MTYSVFNNLSNAQKLADDITQSAEDLDRILVDHAGPFASNCILGSRWRQHNDIDEFTKDGISILSHFIVSDEPISRLIARLARFVGFAVDKRCHDGTTTSMLLFSRLAALAAKVGIGAKDVPTRLRFVREFVATMEDYLEVLEGLKITDTEIVERATALGITTNETEVRGAIAYHMAMISSKGDHELAEKIATMVETTPKAMSGLFKNEPMVVETPERYILEKQAYDLACHAKEGNPDYLNYKSDTQLRLENAVVFAVPKEIVIGTIESEFLTAFISTTPRHRGELFSFGLDKGWEAFHEDKYNLVIMSDGLSDPNLIMAITEFNNANQKVQIVHLVTQVPKKMRTSFDKTLHFVAGKPQFQEVATSDPMACLIGLDEGDNVLVELLGDTLKLSGLYEKSEAVFHPFYDDPEASESYTKFRIETEELIKFAEDNITHYALDQGEIAYLSMLYRALICQHIWDIRIGGLAHEQAANRSVYQDAIGAALSAVDDGVVLCGYAHLAQAGAAAPWSEHQSDIASIFMGIFASAARCEISDLTDPNNIGTMLFDKWYYHAADPEEFLNGSGNHVYTSHLNTKDKLEAFLSKEKGNKPVLIQSWAGYHEQLHRFKDIIPRVANSTHLADMRVEKGADIR